jgi:PAS domain S-box-containing protein
MKVLNTRPEGGFRRAAPFPITLLGLALVLAVGAVDYVTPRSMSFTLIYMLIVAWVGWGGGKWPAVFISGTVVMTTAFAQWILPWNFPNPAWVSIWNTLTRFLVYAAMGWAAAELARLNRDLNGLLKERTTRWQQEVEEHKTTTGRLRETLERFEQVINNITEVFWLTDVAKSQMVYISPGYERIWGRTCEELYRHPRSWLETVHPADRETVARRAQADQAGGGYDVEYRITRPGGAVRWIRDRAFPVRNAQGEVYRIAGLAEDITDRKKTREILQTQAAILESMAEGVVVTDEQGVVVQMNPAAEQIWGHNRSEVLGQPASIFSALPEAEAAGVLGQVLEALRATGSWRGTFKNRRKDGAIIFCDAVISRVEIQGRMLMVAVEQDVTARLRAHEQLQIQARVLESMAEAVLLIDEQAKILLTNPAADALLGYANGELLDQSLLTVTGRSPEEGWRQITSSLAQVKRHGSAAGDYLARRKDGALIEVETRSSGISVDGRWCVVVVGQDITQRKQAEQALRRSEETLRVFLDSVPMPTLLLDREGNILVGNPALARRLGLAPGQLKGRNAFSLLPPEIAQTRRARFEQVVRTRQPAQYEDERAGRHFINFTSPVLDAAGNVQCVTVVALDITERKQAERALARNEELYRTLFELSPDGILLEDTNGNILDANHALCRAFGYSREELLRRNVRCLVPAEHQAEVEPHLAALRSGRSLQHEMWNVRKSGERCLMWLNERPLALPDGRQGILVVARDVTEASQAKSTKEAFLSLGAKLSAAQTPIEAARAIYATADLFWQWDAGALDLLMPGADRLETVLALDTLDGNRREVAAGTPAGPPTARARRIMAQGAELILRQPGSKAESAFVPFGDVTRLSASIMCVPVRAEGQAVGLLSVQSYTRNAFTERDLQTLQALADHCAGALERLRAEQSLRQREQLTSRILTTAMDGFWVTDFATDPQGAIIDVNDALCNLTGYGREELLAMRLTDIEARESPEQVRRHTETIRDQRGDRFETRFRRKDGQEIHVEISASWIADGNKRAFAFIRDITERKRAELTREAFLSLGARLSGADSATEAARAIYASADLLWQWDSASLDLYSSESGALDAVLNCDVVDGQRTEVPTLARGRQPSARMLRILSEGAELILGPPETPGDQFATFGDTSRLSASMMYVPVRREGQPVGVLSIHSYSPNAYTRDDLRTLQALADYCGGALARLRAEEVLRESEETYRALIETTGTGYLILDHQGRVLDANAEYVRLSGHKKLAEIVGRNVVEWTAPTDREKNAAAVEACLKTGAVRNLEVAYTGSGGALQPVEINGTVVTWKQRQTILSLCWDITQRRRAELTKEALLSLGAKLSAAKTPKEAARAICATADLFWNWDAGFLNLYSEERDWMEPVLFLDRVEGQRREVPPPYATGGPPVILKRLLEKGGELILRQPADPRGNQFVRFGDTSRPSASLMYVPIRREGRPVGILSIQSYTPDAFSQDDLPTLQALADHCSEALERIRAETARRESEELNRAILATTMHGFFALDFSTNPLGAIIEANEAYCRMIGYSREELLRMRITDLEAREDPEEVARHKDQILNAGQERFETRHRRKDGREIQVEISACCVPGGGRRIFDFVQDITERKQAELTREALLSLGQKLASASTPADAARAIYVTADSLWQWDCCALDACVPGSDNVETLLACDLINGVRQELALRPGIAPPTGRMRRIMAGGPELILRQPGEMPQDDFVPIGDTSRLSASLMCVPIHLGDQAIGVLSLQSYAPKAYTSGDLRTLQALADHCGGALERIRAEAALRESEEQLRAFYDSPGGLRGIIELTENDALFISANKAEAAIFGRTPEQMRSVRVTALGLPMPFLELWLAKLRESQQVEGPVSFEYPSDFRSPGTWGLATVCPLNLAGSPRPRFAFLAVDITDRKRAESALREAHDQLERRVQERTAELQAANAALRESEARLRLALDASRAGAWSWEAASNQSAWDDRYHELYGFEPHEPRSFQAWIGRLHREDRERILARIRALAEPGGPDAWNEEFRAMHPTRGERWMAGLGRVERDASGRAVRLAGINLDITERRQAQDAQRAQLAYIETIYQNAPVGLCVLDVEFRYVRINDRLAAMNGAPVEHHIGRTVREMVPYLADGTEAVCRQVMSTGQPVLNLELEGTTVAQPGVTRTWVTAWVPLKEADGRVTGVSVLVEEVTERKRMTRALGESEEKYRRLHETMTDAFVSVAMDGSIVECNRAYQDMLGYPGEELRRLTYVELTPGKWHAVEAQLVQEQVLARGYSDVYEKEYRREDGTVFPVELRTFLLRDAGGQAAGMWAIVRDITERKRAEQALREAHGLLEERVKERTAELQAANAALRESEERYRSLVDNLNVGVYRNVPGGQGGFIQANPALARMHGYDSVKEFLNVKVADLYQDPRERQKFLAAVGRKGTLLNYELRLKKKDGTAIYGSVNATAHRNHKGEVDWIDGVLEDITDRKRGEEALRQSEERYRTLAETSPDAIFILCRENKVQYVNSAAASFWGRKPEQVVGLPQTDLFPPEIARRQSQVVAGIFASGESVRRDVLVPFPGGERWLETRLAPMLNEQGAVASVMGVSRDITERKRAERQLVEALDLNQKMLAAATTGIAGYKASGECFFANEALARAVGGSLSAVLQGDFRQAKAWRESGLLRMADEALSQGEARSNEVFCKTRFGKEVWLDCHMATFVSNGEPHLLLMALDISERKRAEQALRNEERLRKAILENIPDPVWLKDVKGRFLAVNEAFTQFYGLPTDAILGRTVFDICRAQADRMVREDREAIKRRCSIRAEGPHTSSRGEAGWFESVKSPLFNERGEVSGTVGIARDITERRQAQLLLQAQRDLGVSLSTTSEMNAALKRLLEFAMHTGAVDGGGVYLLNPATQALDLAEHRGASTAFVEEVKQFAPGSVQMKLVRQGRPIFTSYDKLRMPPDAPGRREGFQAIALVPLTHERKLIGALALGARSVSEIPARTQVVIEALAAQAAGAIARIHAEAERHRLERQLLEISDREQARIGQDIHDGLCQQLVSLAFDANSLHGQLAAGRRAEARTAARIAACLDEAITDARQLSRGLFPVRLEKEGLPPALEELARTTRGRFKIRCRFKSHDGIALQDSTVATHLYRIAQEAVTNAVKHSQARTVAITLSAQANQLELKVEDNGRGLGRHRPKGAGGMGLHIMDYRARSIGGTLRLERRPRGGTTVRCCVPRALS